MSEYLIDIQGLCKHFPVRRGLLGALRGAGKEVVRAVDGIDIRLKKGEILALVGESGSGKTTSALCAAGLIPATKGRILLEGRDVLEMIRNRKQRKALRRIAQVIFQDPYESLNPRQTVFDAVAEPLEVHGLVASQEEKRRRVAEALDAAGLKAPESYFNRYPQELSGGQRQRVVIASALVIQPKLIVADEPVSMLDVSIRAEILNLLRSMRDSRGITVLYITHDLATAAFIADRVAVMYLGVIVEIGKATRVLGNPVHPYTKALMSVIPVPNPRSRRKRIILKGETPSPIHVPKGCRFHPRCPVAFERCSLEEPALREIEPGHLVACWLEDASGST